MDCISIPLSEHIEKARHQHAAMPESRRQGGDALLWLLGLYLLNTVLVLAVAVREAVHPARALAWATVCTLLPVIGFLLYSVLSRSPVHRRSQAQHRPQRRLPHRYPTNALHTDGSALQKAVVHAIGEWSGQEPAPASVRLLINGSETYDEILASIRRATQTVDLDYYIFRDDRIGELFLAALVERAAAGVRIRLLLDGWGSRAFPGLKWRQLQRVNIACRVFFPLRFPWITPEISHRDHSKIVIVDGRTAYTGGINVGDEYIAGTPKLGPWRDTHLCMSGPGIAVLQTLFDLNWGAGTPVRKHRRALNKAGVTCSPNADMPMRRHSDRDGSRIVGSSPPRNRWGAGTAMAQGNQGADSFAQEAFSPQSGAFSGTIAPSALSCSAHVSEPERWPRRAVSAASLSGSDHAPTGARGFDVWVHTVDSGPDRPIQTARSLFFLCLTQARKTVDIATPYFAPEADLTTAFKTAAARGVRLRLLMPKRSDDWLTDMAARTYLSDLIQGGVRVYLYQEGILHAKTTIVDNDITIIGTANYDSRSFHLNYEVCEVLYGSAFAQENSRQFELDLERSARLSAEELDRQSGFRRTLQKCARLVAPTL